MIYLMGESELVNVTAAVTITFNHHALRVKRAV
jgi:hypothetical protein